ncbi:unnamed protein product [Dracunculus medinensis]|uniref:CA domain-containing protein n=1 Tax=Dracunculus medinensis TaxID=318479 RepID=A0A158Q5W3_DRAME|nr:unnamed protein product [Dracunculus medinensis]
MPSKNIPMVLVESEMLEVKEKRGRRSILAKLPIFGNSFGPEPEIQLRLVKGIEIAELDAGQKIIKLKKTLDRDELNISTFVTVKDVNDNAPQFSADSYFFDLPEELPVGTIVFMKIKATDKDQLGPNSFINYRILPSEYSRYLNIVDPTSPILTVADRIDFEQLKQFDLVVEAKDSGDPPRLSTANIHVTVTDIDDLNPIFQHDLYYATPHSKGILDVSPEQIFAIDGDTLGAAIEYSIHGVGSENYAISNLGVVRAISDNVPPATLIVKAKELNRNERFSMTILKIENEQIHFDLSLYSVKLMDNVELNTEIIRIHAISPNKEINITYNIENREEAIVDVDKLTGWVFIKAPLKDKKYSYRLSATDGKMKAWTRLDIAVENNKAPIFDKNSYSFRIGQTSSIGSVRASVSENTIKKNDRFELKSKNWYFTIDDNGQIKKLMKPPLPAELVVIAEGLNGLRSFTTVNISLDAIPISTFTTVSAIIFGIIVLFSIILIFIVIRRLINIWRQKHVCWLRTTGNNSIIMSKSKSFDSGYPIEEENEKNRDLDNYMNSSSFPVSISPLRTLSNFPIKTTRYSFQNS